MRALALGLLSVAALVITPFNPPAGAMILGVVSCWFMWRYG